MPSATQPVTVLYLHSSDDLYGSDMILLQIVLGLDRGRFTPVVVLPDDMRHVGLLSAELSAHGIEWMHLPIAIIRRRYLRPGGIWSFLGKAVRGTWALRRLARQRQAGMIHGFTLAVAAAPLAALACGVPLVMHAHEILPNRGLVRRLLHAIGVRFAERVVCVSEATRNNILEDEPSAAARLQVIHNGIRSLPQPTSSVAELRERMGVPVDRPLVGMIGRVSAWKGQDVFLRAAAIVDPRGTNCHFVAIGGVFDGDTQHLERLQQIRRDLHLEETVTLLDFMKDAREMLTSFDISILPSTSPEPFGIVILEAMSAGVAVIASAHGGPLEMVVDGVTGLLVRPGDSRALAAGIERLLGDPPLRRQMGEAGRQRMLQHFELSGYLDAIQTLYASVLREAASGRME
jgi:glycosyltransferase involved in cell wall biosynthesis